MWTAARSGNTEAMIRDDWRLRYDHSSPKREGVREREVHNVKGGRERESRMSLGKKVSEY